MIPDGGGTKAPVQSWTTSRGDTDHGSQHTPLIDDCDDGQVGNDYCNNTEYNIL
jgi:hypothetical protein